MVVERELEPVVVAAPEVAGDARRFDAPVAVAVPVVAGDGRR